MAIGNAAIGPIENAAICIVTNKLNDLYVAEFTTVSFLSNNMNRKHDCVQLIERRRPNRTPIEMIRKST